MDSETKLLYSDFPLDLDTNRLQKAKEMGADYCIQVTKEMTAKDIAVKVRECFGDLANQTIECTGAEPSICAGIYVSGYDLLMDDQINFL